MLSDELQEEIRQMIREEYQQLADKELQFSEEVPTQSGFIWKCLGKVKNSYVWIRFCQVGLVLTVYTTTSFLVEIVCPGTMPDVNYIARSIHDFADDVVETPGSPVLKNSDRYIAFNDQWRNFQSDEDIQDIANDESMKNWTFNPESSGIVDTAIFDRGYPIVGTGSGTDENFPNDYPEHDTTTTTTPAPLPPPPSYPGSGDLDYA